MNANTLQAYAETKILWAKMMRALKLPQDSMFVGGICETTPYYHEYNESVSRLQRCIAAERGQ